MLTQWLKTKTSVLFLLSINYSVYIIYFFLSFEFCFQKLASSSEPCSFWWYCID